MTTIKAVKRGSMKDTVTLDGILFAQYQLGRAHQRISMDEKRKVGGEITESKAEIIKLFEQAVESAKPEKKYSGKHNASHTWVTNSYCRGCETQLTEQQLIEDFGYNEGLDDYEQNLKQALSNSGKAGE